MAGRKRRFTPPAGFTQDPKLRADYEENGVAMGRFYLWYEDRAIRAWGMLGGCLGPRWKLEVYRYHWIKDNPDDYKRYKKFRGKTREREKRKRDVGKMSVSREQAKRLNAHPKPKPPEGPENYDPKLFPHDGLDA